MGNDAPRLMAVCPAAVPPIPDGEAVSSREYSREQLNSKTRRSPAVFRPRRQTIGHVLVIEAKGQTLRETALEKRQAARSEPKAAARGPEAQLLVQDASPT